MGRHFVAQLLEKHTAQVALTERWQHDHDQLASILRALAHANCRNHRRARRDAHQQAFFGGQASRHHQRIVARNLHDLVDVISTQNAGDEAGANALNLMRRRLATGEYSTLDRLDRNRFERGLARLDVLRDSGDGASGADARDEDIHLAIGVGPNLRPGGLKVNFGVGRIVELLRDKAIGCLGENFLRLGDCALHAFGAGGQDELCSEGAQQDAALRAHGLRHHDDQPVAFHRRDECQSDPGVAARGLDQHGLAGMDLARFFGFGDHADADAVFDAGARIEALEFRDDGGADAVGHAVEAHQRSMPD